MDLYAQIAEKIIKQQETIIGPIAVVQAKKIDKLKIDWPEHSIDVKGDPPAVIDQLVEVYKDLFGQIAVQTCKEAAGTILAKLPPEQRPNSLK